MSQLRPTKGLVFVLPEETGPSSDTLYVPSTVKNRDMPSIGRVMAMGGCRVTKKGVKVDPGFRVGDRVYFPKFTGLWTDVRGQKWVLVKQHDIHGLFES